MVSFWISPPPHPIFLSSPTHCSWKPEAQPSLLIKTTRTSSPQRASLSLQHWSEGMASSHPISFHLTACQGSAWCRQCICSIANFRRSKIMSQVPNSSWDYYKNVLWFLSQIWGSFLLASDFWAVRVHLLQLFWLQRKPWRARNTLFKKWKLRFSCNPLVSEVGALRKPSNITRLVVTLLSCICYLHCTCSLGWSSSVRRGPKEGLCSQWDLSNAQILWTLHRCEFHPHGLTMASFCGSFFKRGHLHGSFKVVFFLIFPLYSTLAYNVACRRNKAHSSLHLAC